MFALDKQLKNWEAHFRGHFFHDATDYGNISIINCALNNLQRVVDRQQFLLCEHQLYATTENVLALPIGEPNLRLSDNGNDLPQISEVLEFAGLFEVHILRGYVAFV